MPTGTVRFFNDEKGYGFIRPDNDAERDCFCHAKQVEASGLSALARGDRVEFVEWLNDRTGKSEATSLRLLSGSEARR